MVLKEILIRINSKVNFLLVSSHIIGDQNDNMAIANLGRSNGSVLCKRRLSLNHSDLFKPESQSSSEITCDSAKERLIPLFNGAGYLILS